MHKEAVYCERVWGLGKSTPHRELSQDWFSNRVGILEREGKRRQQQCETIRSRAFLHMKKASSYLGLATGCTIPGLISKACFCLLYLFSLLQKMLGCQCQRLKSFVYLLKGAAWVFLYHCASVALPWSTFPTHSVLAKIDTKGVRAANHGRGCCDMEPSPVGSLLR